MQTQSREEQSDQLQSFKVKTEDSNISNQVLVQQSVNDFIQKGTDSSHAVINKQPEIANQLTS